METLQNFLSYVWLLTKIVALLTLIYALLNACLEIHRTRRIKNSFEEALSDAIEDALTNGKPVVWSEEDIEDTPEEGQEETEEKEEE